MASKPAAKKTVNRRRQRPAESAETVAHAPAPGPIPVAPEQANQSGPVQLTPNPALKNQRLLQKLMQAEDEASSFAAIADGLLERNNELEANNKQLMTRIRELELELFPQDEGAEEEKK
jgi:hypothetical protein